MYDAGDMLSFDAKLFIEWSELSETERTLVPGITLKQISNKSYFQSRENLISMYCNLVLPEILRNNNDFSFLQNDVHVEQRRLVCSETEKTCV